jgi:hypothetical protein
MLIIFIYSTKMSIVVVRKDDIKKCAKHFSTCDEGRQLRVDVMIESEVVQLMSSILDITGEKYCAVPKIRSSEKFVWAGEYRCAIAKS